MSKKALVPLLTGATLVMMALPVVGALRGGHAAASDASAPQVCAGYVALTFDDGPTPMTKDLLGLLEKHHVRATMFDIGEQVEGRPDVVKAQLDGGHAVENHTFTHPDLTKLGTTQVVDEVTKTNGALRDAGAHPTWFRAPYGYTDDRVATGGAASAAGG